MIAFKGSLIFGGYCIAGLFIGRRWIDKLNEIMEMDDEELTEDEQKDRDDIVHTLKKTADIVSEKWVYGWFLALTMIFWLPILCYVFIKSIKEE